MANLTSLPGESAFGLLNAGALWPSPEVAAALVSFATAIAATGLVWRVSIGRKRGQMPSNLGVLSDGCVFLFSGRRLWLASEEGHRFLQEGGTVADAWSALRDRIRSGTPESTDQLERLVKYGEGFTRDIEFSDGTILQLEGQPRGGLSALYVRDITSDRRARILAEKAALDLASRNREMSGALDLAPVMFWRRDKDGTVHSANRPFHSVVLPDARSEQDPAQPKALGHFQPETKHADGQPTRVPLAIRQGSGVATEWFSVTEHETEDGNIMGFGANISSLVKAEETLQRFIATLTETFAHLPIGLAVFDDNRRLGLFNPAIADLLPLETPWLAQRPSLREFLDKLRDAGIAPEQKSYEQWRAQIRRIDQQAEAGSLSEKWVLPQGQTLQLTGRPHPHGAVALLFEDVTSTAMMEQRYRSDIELSQATLDRLSEAVSVFDTAGAMVFCNSAFEKMWSVEPMKTVHPPNILEMTELWSRASGPTPVWGDLRGFVTGAEERAAWSEYVDLQDGRRLHGAFAPMPDGSTLCVFSEVSDIVNLKKLHRSELATQRSAYEKQLDTLNLALDHLRGSVIDASADLGGLPAGDTAPETGPAQDRLNAALMQGDALMAIQNPTTPETTIQDLEPQLNALLAPRSLELRFTVADTLANAPLTPDIRRVFFNMCLSALELSSEGQLVEISLNADGRDAHAVLELPGASVKAASSRMRRNLAARLLRRHIETIGGSFGAEDTPQGGLTLTAQIPDAAEPDTGAHSQDNPDVMHV